MKLLFIVKECLLHLYNLQELDYIQTTKSRLTNKLSFNMNQSVFSLAALILGMSVFIWVRPSEHSNYSKPNHILRRICCNFDERSDNTWSHFSAVLKTG